eukprot:4817064-Pleurochrysis_carterae.AAC.1
MLTHARDHRLSRSPRTCSRTSRTRTSEGSLTHTHAHARARTRTSTHKLAHAHAQARIRTSTHTHKHAHARSHSQTQTTTRTLTHDEAHARSHARSHSRAHLCPLGIHFDVVTLTLTYCHARAPLRRFDRFTSALRRPRLLSRTQPTREVICSLVHANVRAHPYTR